MLGTLGYMAPEQVRGEAVDQRADLFNFGAILYEMLSGQRAFRGKSDVETLHAIVKEETRSRRPESPRSIRPATNHTALPGEEPAGALPVRQRYRF